MFLGAAIVTEVFLPPGAYASSSADLRQASQYAAAAAKAGSKSVAHSDLQRVLNCLIGQSSGNYDQAVSDGCSNKGLVNELPGSSVTHAQAEEALRIAEVGLSTEDLAVIHKLATAAHNLLSGKAISGEYN
nr:hypothetical protein [uncultured Acidocella sp.]